MGLMAYELLVIRLAATVSMHFTRAKGQPSMAGKRGNAKWSSFAKFRHTWICEADRIMKDCEEWTATDVSKDDKSRRLWQRSAHLHERAADFYRRASLGLLAVAAWQKAADCYAILGIEEDADRCRRKAITIPVYWSDDQRTQHENRGGHP
jgi:hypothetical protein